MDPYLDNGNVLPYYECKLKCQVQTVECAVEPGLEVKKKLEYSLRLKIKCNDWLLADVSACGQSLCFILSPRMNSSFITSRPGTTVKAD